MAGQIKRLAGPVGLTNVYTTNVYNNTSALIYDVIRHIHVANKSAAAVTFRLYLGATGANVAGTELFYDYSIAANSALDWYGALKLLSTDFLVGGASVASGAAAGLAITIEGEQVVV